MPLARFTLPHELSPATRDALLAEASKVVSEVLGKPERYVMVIVEQAAIRFAASASDAAFVDIRSIGGLDAGSNAVLAARLCELVERYAGVTPQRTFLNFSNVERSHWGHDGATF